MKSSTKAILLTLAVAIPALFLGPIIWPPADIGVTPSDTQLPLFIGLSVGDALLFGAGVSFVVFGYPIVRRVASQSRRRAQATYVCIAYILLSWWPHLNLHAAGGFDLDMLLVVDFTFHLPLEIAGVVLAYCFLAEIREQHPTAMTPQINRRSDAQVVSS